MKTLNNNLDRIFIDNVHSYWRFKKFEFQIAFEEFYIDTVTIEQLLNSLNDSSKNDEIDNAKIIDRAIFDPSNFDSNKKFSKFLKFFRGLKRNVHIERLFSNSTNSIDENFKNVALFNVNESRTVKAKGRQKNFKNQKNFITRKKKKTAKSTRRKFSRFEHVEAVIEIFQKRNRGRVRNRTREDREFESREEFKSREKPESRGERGERNKRNEQIASFIVSQKLQTLKKKAKTNQRKKQ